MRAVAGVAALGLAAAALSSCAVAGSPAVADPAFPTIGSIEPPAPAPAPRPRPAPATGTSKDETEIRQAVNTYWDAYSRADWDAILTVTCPAAHETMSDQWKHNREVMGPPPPIVITGVTITGDTATAYFKVGTVPTGFPLRRSEAGWKICS